MEGRPLMEVVRGEMLDKKPNRLSVQHIELRDQAITAIERAQAAVRRLADVERGEKDKATTSPRFQPVTEIAGELGALEHRLDRIYV